MDFSLFTPRDRASQQQEHEVRDFLFTHLEQYGDARADIGKAIDFALGKGKGLGGFVLAGKDQGRMVGAVVVNDTGMQGYIPEHILVYIAVDNSQRGKGYGRQLMEKAIATASGNIALHVEPDNPARHLYEKLGFTSKYLEMRLTRPHDPSRQASQGVAHGSSTPG